MQPPGWVRLKSLWSQSYSLVDIGANDTPVDATAGEPRPREMETLTILITLALVGRGYSTYFVCLSVCYHKIAVNFNYLEI